MKKILAAAAILALLAACRDESGSGRHASADAGVTGTPPSEPYAFVYPAPAPPTWAAFDIVVDDFDPGNNSVWIQWQDDNGFVWSDLLLPSGNSDGYGTDSQVYMATPGINYWLVLTDYSGSGLDSVPLGALQPGDVVLRSFVIVGYKLVPI